MSIMLFHPDAPFFVGRALVTQAIITHPSSWCETNQADDSANLYWNTGSRAGIRRQSNHICPHCRPDWADICIDRSIHSFGIVLKLHCPQYTWQYEGNDGERSCEGIARMGRVSACSGLMSMNHRRRCRWSCVNTTRRTPGSPSVYMLKAFKGNAFDGILNGLVIVMVSVNLAVALVFDMVGVHFACVAANGVILGVRRHDDWRTVILLAGVLIGSITFAIIGLHDMLFAYGAYAAGLGVVAAMSAVLLAVPTHPPRERIPPSLREHILISGLPAVCS